MTEFAEGIWVCGMIFTVLGSLLLLLHGLGLAYRWIRGMIWRRSDKGMIGRRIA